MPERIRPGLVAVAEQRDRWKRVRPLFGRPEKDRHRCCSRACAGESERFTDECEGMLAVGMRAVTYVPPEQFGTDRRVNSVMIEIAVTSIWTKRRGRRRTMSSKHWGFRWEARQPRWDTECSAP